MLQNSILPQQTNRLYYKKIASAQNEKAIIFLHGLGGSHNFWKNDYHIFSTTYSLYFIDLLGFGMSPKPDASYTLAAHVQALEQFISSEVKEQEYMLIGHSLGAILALSYMSLHQNKNIQSILMGIPYYHSQNEAYTLINNATKYPRWLYTDTLRAKILCTLMCQMGKPLSQLVFPLFFPHIPPSLVQDVFLHSYRSMMSTLKNVIFSQNIPQLLSSRIKEQTLFLHGVYDRLVPLENIIDLTNKEHLKLVTIPGDHGFPFNQTQQTISVLKNYL